MISNMSLSIFNFQLFCVHVCVFLASIGVASFCLIWQAVFSSPSYVSFPYAYVRIKDQNQLWQDTCLVPSSGLTSSHS